MTAQALHLHEDRLFSAEPTARAIARRLLFIQIDSAPPAELLPRRVVLGTVAIAPGPPGPPPDPLQLTAPGPVEPAP